MLRWKSLLVVAALAVSLPVAARADNFSLIGGEFTFTHAPVNPELPDDIQFEPPGLIFDVTSNRFDGQLLGAGLRLSSPKKGLSLPTLQLLHLPFSGSSAATGCVYLYPSSTLLAEFTGAFVWQTAEGELHGSFYMQNHYLGLDHILGASVFITFEGGTGRFQTASGEALAIGLDMPFGGLGGDPATAGVVAAVIGGNLRID